MGQSNSTKKTVLIIGGSFGGLTAAKILAKKFNVIVVDKKTFFEFTPSFHYALQNPDYIDRITADIQNYANKNNFKFIRASVTKLDSNQATLQESKDNFQTVLFDYCIIATGSNYASSVKSTEEIQTLQQRKEQMKQLIDKFNKSKKVLVVGGGAVGVEIAGLVKDQFKHLQVELWTKPQELLPQFPKRARRLADSALKKLGIKIEYGKAIEKLPESQYDYIFDCRGNIYSPSFMMNEVFKQYVDSKGRIVVDQFMRLENHKHIFCIGDACITPNDEPKMSYNASIQGQFAAQNIIKTENNDTSLKRLVDSSNIYNITTSKKQAILCLGEKIAFESITVYYTKMMIEIITCQSFKGSSFYGVVGDMQKSLLIFMAYVFSKINRKKYQNQNLDSSTHYQKLK
ncbi:pyridine nucleotide-disulfide oxidoreductase (macronuclear) [Tetrahymena thermophila SB210]|uniref:Pyridine nucleotide-disulfide oxidoreductase n=1 Tax=Tetrahymena thermophila (strain SB210) TaxID=312017 RepID=I7M6Y3_TETTS|nr:pyridine nucleotide-disulfide oxidoreductase [Tetrahymena thermophila SB210]EAR87487.1 pyridine nucleotide-disulfide oxidoreductase [Tetrahymena thermophila SB210]|eukprot:XP_001007732.1 pyridine nucleotide-disulfide oxidoreductase [Tetrahymena thermophila SB210]